MYLVLPTILVITILADWSLLIYAIQRRHPVKASQGEISPEELRVVLWQTAYHPALVLKSKTAEPFITNSWTENLIVLPKTI